MRVLGRTMLAAAAAVALVGVLVQQGVALAATALPSGHWVTPTGPQPATTDFTVRTTRPRWSVAVLRPGYLQGDPTTPLPEYDLQLLNGSTVAAGSAYRDAVPDFVAIDGSIRSPQRYTVRVLNVGGVNPGEQYGLTFADGRNTLPQGQSLIQAPGGSQPNNVYVRDLNLKAATGVTVTIAATHTTCPENVGTLYLDAWLLGSDPSKPATALQGRGSALAHEGSLHQDGTSCAVTVYAPIFRSGRYGLVIFAAAFPQLSVTVESSNLIG